MTTEETIPEDHEDHDMVEPLHEKNSHKRKPSWARELIQDAERYGALDGMHRERKRHKPC